MNYDLVVVFNNYDLKWLGISYTHEYIISVALSIAAGSIILSYYLRDIDDWRKFNSENYNIKKNELNKVYKKCISAPYIIYLINVLAPLTCMFISIAVIFVFMFDVSILLVIKIGLVVFSFLSSASIITLVFSKKIFINILSNLQEENTNGFRISFNNKIFIQVIPLLTVSIIMTSFLGYSRLITEKGNLLSKAYKLQLDSIFENNKNFGNADEIMKKLKSARYESTTSCYFIIYPDKKTYTSDNSMLSTIFINYCIDLSLKNGGEVCDFTGDSRGVCTEVAINGKKLIAGIKFQVYTRSTIWYFILSFVFLIGINIFVLHYFSKSVTNDISLITRNLEDIANGKLKGSIPVTSNDEIGDLVAAFNRIQKLVASHIEQLKHSQDVLVQHDRLVSLGHLAGGIAHSLKTPIVSIADTITIVEDLVKEYEESVEDPRVTSEDHKAIAEDMKKNLESIRSLIKYMNGIISTVKNQSSDLSSVVNSSFTVEELLNSLLVLMNDELKKNSCKFNTFINIDTHRTINGDIRNLVQVLNVLVSNSIDSYDGNGGVVDFQLEELEDSILLTVRDYGKGIADEIKDRIFNNMVTTKGTKGTGIGLYISRSIIRGNFSGDLTFISELGKGSTFSIVIPLI
ncbi:MAG TPA: HAMP domain-containing sensor histidine kinase [Clostridia bacterium]